MRTRHTAALLAIFAAAPVLASGPAATTIRATLAAPTDASNPVKGYATTWTCTATNCVGPVFNARHGDERACRELARAVGPVTSYDGAKGALSPDALARCNRSARSAP